MLLDKKRDKDGIYLSPESFRKQNQGNLKAQSQFSGNIYGTIQNIYPLHSDLTENSRFFRFQMSRVVFVFRL